MKKTLFVVMACFCTTMIVFSGFFGLSGCKYRDQAGEYTSDRLYNKEKTDYWIGKITLKSNGDFEWVRMNNGESESSVIKENKIFPNAKYFTGTFSISGSVITFKYKENYLDEVLTRNIEGSITAKGSIKLTMNGTEGLYKKTASGGCN